MAVDELVKVVSPPYTPEDAPVEGSWKHVVEAVGFDLPQDYRDFGERYGTGTFSQGFLRVVNPFAPWYRKFIDKECEILRELEEAAGNPMPYPVYPKRPGLLPWGSDESGHTMYWFTEGPPDQWPIILKTHDVNFDNWPLSFERWEMSMTTFLAKALSNEIKCLLWRQQPFSKKDRTFRSGLP